MSQWADERRTTVAHEVAELRKSIAALREENQRLVIETNRARRALARVRAALDGRDE